MRFLLTLLIVAAMMCASMAELKNEGRDTGNNASSSESSEGEEEYPPVGAHEYVVEAVCIMGAGAQGARVASLLAGARMVVHVWDASRERADALVDEYLNVEAHDKPEGALRECDVVVTCLESAQQDLRVLGSVAERAVLEGKPWVQLSGNLEEMDQQSVRFAAERKMNLIGTHTHCKVEDYGKPYCEFFTQGDLAKASASHILWEAFAALGRVVRHHSSHEEL